MQLCFAYDACIYRELEDRFYDVMLGAITGHTHAQLSCFGMCKCRVVIAGYQIKDLNLCSGLKHCYLCGRSEVQLLGRSNGTQCRQYLATVATFLRSCVAQALCRRDGLRQLFCNFLLLLLKSLPYSFRFSTRL